MFHTPGAPSIPAAHDQYEMHRVDVRGVDHDYVENVLVYLDRGLDLYHLPEASAARLGRPADDGVNYLLMADWVEAGAEVIEVGGARVAVWTVPVNQLVTRPSVISPEQASLPTRPDPRE